MLLVQSSDFVGIFTGLVECFNVTSCHLLEKSVSMFFLFYNSGWQIHQDYILGCRYSENLYILIYSRIVESIIIYRALQI